MNLKDKTVIVTGAGQGIGAAIAHRFAIEGARIVAADIDGAAATATASVFGGFGVPCDVTCEAEVQELVARTEARFGPVDLFCSNAGICRDEPGHAASASDDDWMASWNVHVMAHVYAARAVLPSMIDRGEGYLLQMASAAGLLSQIGNAAYSTTKHATIGFAESLAISHGGDGIRVSVICPQYVATPMLGYDESDALAGLPGVLSPASVADAVVRGVADETFLILPHRQVSDHVRFKAADRDKWLAAMRALRARIVDEAGTLDLAAMHKLI